MKIVLCNGGLGNQVFQYIFSRWLELATGDACYLNDAIFWSEKPEHNGFEIPRVFPNSKPRLLSSYFTEDVWRYMVDRQCAGGYLFVSRSKIQAEILSWRRRRTTIALTEMWWRCPQMHICPA